MTIGEADGPPILRRPPLANTPALLVPPMRRGPRRRTTPRREVPSSLRGRLACFLLQLTRPIPQPHRDETRSQRFDRHPASVAAARRFTRDCLVGQPLEESETAELLVSELVTNAVRYGAGPILLTVTVLGRSLRCEVTDAHPAAPCFKEAAADDESGRGMQLLHELSHRCGVRPAHPGKTVWFELRCAGSTDASVHCLDRLADP
ncbi:anti-sigma regulatory factor (Ser/Thr protein kinase) [Kitasatospora sp. GAS204A]|uniref:ATP-binding protein n=1 Tax=Kitasatospora sp. GAS204A TaxID=3349328 RepID=UPI00247EB607|nr:anti-sigma regulatory factor (Ser/Thr protein kinase) [Kitasatospora sp. GAS204B]